MRSRNVSAARLRAWCWALLLPWLLVARSGTAFAATDRVIYDEALAAGW
jgi:hypothetical protein